MEIFTQQGGEILARWGHYLAGVTWIGLLYYFNFVQVPALAATDDASRSTVVRTIAPRALWWFRWGAVMTVLTGLSITAFAPAYRIDGFWRSPSGYSITTGMTLALVMFGNVWGVIWPRQKVVLASGASVAAGGAPDPAAAAAGRTALLASRTNTVLSIPMLFFMAATSHFAPFFGGAEAAGRGVYAGFLLLVVVILELNALGRLGGSAPGGARSYLDTHQRAIGAGFALTAAFYVVFEVVFG